MSRLAHNTLYVTTPGAYLSRDGATFTVRHGDEIALRVPAIHLESIVVGTDAVVTGAAIELCAEADIHLIFVDWSERIVATILSPGSRPAMTARDQHRRAEDAEWSLGTAREFIGGKMRNQRWVLARIAREADDAVLADRLRIDIGRMDCMRDRVRETASADDLRGMEGECGSIYFGAISDIVAASHTDVCFEGRNRRPPRDAVNAMLSFGYMLLASDCATALSAAGLDPNRGFLHVVRAGRPALALDLMEEFRPPIVDRLCLAMIRRRQFKQKNVKEFGGGYRLESSFRKEFIAAYQEQKEQTIKHPAQKTPVRWGDVPLLQARILARAVRGEGHYRAFLPE